MPIRKVQFVKGEFYHIIKRGIEEREIFLDDEDRLRFINSLLVFNDTKPCPWQSRAFWFQRNPTSLLDYRPQNPLVEIHAFVLMRNHFHLLLRQLLENGVIKLMRKLGGYSYYFNKKYRRGGTLFQSRYKATIIKNESYLKTAFVYIHTNPAEIIEPGWKKWRVRDSRRTIEFLENEYRWSSYWDYIGKQNFPQITNRDFFSGLLGKEQIREEVGSWIQFKNEIFNDKERLERIIFE